MIEGTAFSLPFAVVAKWSTQLIELFMCHIILQEWKVAVIDVWILPAIVVQR